MPKLDVIGFPQYPYAVTENPKPQTDTGSVNYLPDDSPVGKSTSSAQIKESLTNVTNQPQSNDPDGSQRPASARDVYGNNTWKEGDNWQQVATRSPRDPAGLENPESGAYHSEHPLFCDTCGRLVLDEEIAFPAHLGHDIRNDYGKTDFDITHATRCGGTFPVGYGSPTILPPNPNYDVGYPSKPAGFKAAFVGDPIISGDPQDRSNSYDTLPPAQFPKNYISTGWTRGSIAGGAGGSSGRTDIGPLGSGGQTGVNNGRAGTAPLGGFPADDNNWMVQKNEFAFAPQPFNIIPSVQAIPDCVFGGGEIDAPNSQSLLDQIVDVTTGKTLVNP